MSVAATLVTCRSPARLRNRLIDEYRAAARGKIGAALWIGPSREAVNEVRSRLGSLLAPLLFDWEALGRYILHPLEPSLRFLTATRQRLLLQEAVAQVRRQRPFNCFERIAETRGFLDAAAGMLAELYERGIGADALSATVAAEPEKDARWRKHDDAARIAAQYVALLREQKAHDPAELLHLAGERLASAATTPLASVESIFVESGLNLAPAQLALLRQLADRAKRLWVGLPDEEGGARAELFQVCRGDRDAFISLFPGSTSLQVEDDDDGPAGLRHLRRTIFMDDPVPSPAADGLALIEAPAVLGEARLVARRIRQLLAADVPPERIGVTARRLAGLRDLLAEVFDEYEVPFDLEGDESLARSPIVMTLLRAVRLPEDGWPFGGVTALLRNTEFQPQWAECRDDPEMPRHAEALLRMLGEPRGDKNVLRAVDNWADRPPPALEDERAEESRRQRKIELARRARPFLRRFFAAWDRFPLQGSLATYAQALREFAADLNLGPLLPPLGRGGGGGESLVTPPPPPSKGGEKRVSASQVAAKNLSASSFQDEKTRTALAQLFDEVDAWSASAPTPTLGRSAFIRLLGVIASGARPAPHSTAGRVRIRSAEAAACLDADYLCVLGLGERSFPDLSPPDSLLDDADRQILRDAGLPLANSSERLPDEMLLFYRLLNVPREELILSYPAVDQKGQPLLPSTFLRGVRDCFVDKAIPVEHQRMLIEGYFDRPPLSGPEWRVHLAAALKDSSDNPAWRRSPLPESMTANLRDAAGLARSRFEDREFGAYDGILAQPAIIEQLRERFGPERIFSPTALEAYIACPFRFFLGNVLRLEEVEEPSEEVEASRRGSAFHRALARYHAKLREEGRLDAALQTLDEGASLELQADVDKAVREYQQRAPTDAAEVLWELERQRLARFAARYHAHWRDFVGPWQERSALPAPRFLEADFGLPGLDGAGKSTGDEQPPLTIQVGDVEVRIGGRIDRVDVAELTDGLGFWIIDYKTGLAKHYGDRALKTFEKLQLSLYALAVQRVFYGGEARPLGLAYWLVTDSGPKPVLPGMAKRDRFAWLERPENWERFSEQLQEWVAKLATQIREGRFPLAPRSEHCTDTCPYSHVCRIAQSRNTGKRFGLALPGAYGDRLESDG
jgi:ATP-dependent helicase/nuclease subunit B